MAGEDDRNNEVFIDADSGFANEKNSYEVIILNQINACVRVLSREMTGGQVMHKETKTGTENYMEDVRELVIMHVDTLRMLMCTYIKDHNKEQIDMLLQALEDYKIAMGEKQILVPGKGLVSVKNFKGFDVEHPIWKEYINFKALKFREMFEVLVNAYNEQKAFIRSLEEE
jgi:hypothetical protein